MKFSDAINLFIADWTSQGRLRSPRSELAYRATLYLHSEDIGNRDPSKTGRDDVKTTLARWANPNTQYTRRAHLVSFYDWCMEEGLRETNPARQTPRPRKRPVNVYRLTRAECLALIDATQGIRERRAILLGLLVGARNQELRGLQRRHFERGGCVWISPDIAKGGRERFVPLLAELEDVVADILRTVKPGEYVISARRSVGGLHQTVYRETPRQPCSPQAIRKLVADVAERAGIAAHIHPHLLRHAFGDHVARYAGLRAAQALLGHASIDTTESTYTSGPSLDELAISLSGFSYRGAYAPADPPTIPLKAPSGFEPEDSPVRGAERDSDKEGSA